MEQTEEQKKAQQSKVKFKLLTDMLCDRFDIDIKKNKKNMNIKLLDRNFGPLNDFSSVFEENGYLSLQLTEKQQNEAKKKDTLEQQAAPKKRGRKTNEEKARMAEEKRLADIDKRFRQNHEKNKKIL